MLGRIGKGSPVPLTWCPRGFLSLYRYLVELVACLVCELGQPGGRDARLRLIPLAAETSDVVGILWEEPVCDLKNSSQKVRRNSLRKNQSPRLEGDHQFRLPATGRGNDLTRCTRRADR